MCFAPSEYQAAVFAEVQNPDCGSLIIQAVSGSGKTSTIVKMLDYISGSVIMLAFNKSISEELKRRVPSHVMVGTFHSVGLNVWKSYTGKKFIKVSSDKIFNIIKNDLDERQRKLYWSFITKMISLGKSAGIGTYYMDDSTDNWAELADYHDVSLDQEDADFGEAFSLCSKILKKSNDLGRFEVDFDDMLYLPMKERICFPKYDWVVIDEAQDTNGVQRELLKRMISEEGKLVACGDKGQSIYGFRGADSSAMSLIQKEFSCKPLPLSISYRCSRAVIRAAQEYVPEIEWCDAAPEGKVDSLADYSASFFEATDAVLCRNSAPLISFAYGLISRGKGFNFLGRDIGKNLINLITKIGGKSLDDFRARMEVWYEREFMKLSEAGKNDKAAAIDDQYNSINVIIDNLNEGNQSVKGIVDAINALFEERKSGNVMTLCTVHKSKGLEWKRVFILARDKMPSKFAKQEWQKIQENNIIYVAFTRAVLELYFINSDCWNDKVSFSAPVKAPEVKKEIVVKPVPSRVSAKINPFAVRSK
jgi:superfamily I DNA/RNA helicase